MFQDFRFAIRSLKKSPGFTAVAVLTLTLGIGATSAIFSLVYGILLRPLPYPEPDQIVQLVMRFGPSGRMNSTTASKYLFWREHQHTLEAVAAYGGGSGSINLEEAGHAERIQQMAVTADFFRVLKLQPLVGRTFLAGEDAPGGPAVAVMSHSLWKGRFGADPNIVGRVLTLNGKPFTVIGVAPPGLNADLTSDLWTPLRLTEETGGGGNNTTVLARVRPDMTMAQVQADLQVVAEQYRSSHPKGMNPKETLEAASYKEEVIGDSRLPLLILLGAVSLVMLIACANVANLLLSRVTARNREIAVRSALGASRARILRQLFAEGLCLSFLGGAAGLFLAPFLVQGLLALKPSGLPRLDEVAVDARILIFSLLVAVATAVLFSLAPAWQILGSNVQTALQSGGDRSGTSRVGMRMRSAMVIAEFAMSVILLSGATLLVRSFLSLRSVNPGFDAAHALTLRTVLTGPRFQTPEQVSTFVRRSLERIERIPGVETAAVTNYLPLEHGMNIPLGSIEGRPNPGARFLGNLEWYVITPHFLDALHIPVQKGRAFHETDTALSPPRVIVNQAFAKTYFPRENPLGQRVTIAWNLLGPQFADVPREIVGVAENVREHALSEPPLPSVFIPLSQLSPIMIEAHSFSGVAFVVRAHGDPATVQRQVTAEVAAVDPLLPVFQVRTMEDVLDHSVERQRFQTLLLSSFAVLALLLAAIGIYGVLSYTVTQRRREIGIRSAVGAQPGDMIHMIVRNGLQMAVSGLLIGTAGSFALTRFLKSLLFEIGPGDPVSLLAMSLILLSVALLACWVPARRAAKVDPMIALRYE